jgi:putative transposase
VNVTSLEFCSKKEQKMKRSRFSEEQIIGILREAAGSPIKAVCAAHNISTATYHAWKRRFGGMDVSEAKRLRALEEENSRLKRLVADQAVQIHILKEVNAKKW